MQAFGFDTPKLQKRVADALLAETSTLFSPLPGSLEASLDLAPVEGLSSNVNESEEDEESETELQSAAGEVSWSDGVRILGTTLS